MNHDPCWLDDDALDDALRALPQATPVTPAAAILARHAAPRRPSHARTIALAVAAVLAIALGAVVAALAVEGRWGGIEERGVRIAETWHGPRTAVSTTTTKPVTNAVTTTITTPPAVTPTVTTPVTVTDTTTVTDTATTTDTTTRSDTTAPSDPSKVADTTTDRTRAPNPAAPATSAGITTTTAFADVIARPAPPASVHNAPAHRLHLSAGALTAPAVADQGALVGPAFRVGWATTPGAERAVRPRFAIDAEFAWLRDDAGVIAPRVGVELTAGLAAERARVSFDLGWSVGVHGPALGLDAPADPRRDPMLTTGPSLALCLRPEGAPALRLGATVQASPRPVDAEGPALLPWIGVTAGIELPLGRRG